MNRQEREKGKLEIDVKWEGITCLNVREIIERIQNVSERVLYHWKTFPINLPPSIVDSRSVCIKDLFLLPTFDELDALTTDCKGNPKFLSHNQLESIKRKGQFSVPSINFPGQIHVWKLNPLFQKGIETAREEYLDGISFAFRFLFVYVPQLIIGESVSLWRSLLCLKKDIFELLDLIIGFGKVYSPNLERRIQEERCKYLVAELKCKGDGAKEVGRYVRNQSNKAMREKVTMAMERPPSIPYRFSTPVSLDVDLRLLDRDVFRKVGPPLGRILEKSGRGWFLSFREKLIAELKTKKMTESQIEMEANRMMMDEYLRRVYNSVRKCPELNSIGQDIDKLLVEQAQQYILMHRAVDTVALKMESELRDIKKYYVGEYPVLSRDPVWIQMKLKTAETNFCEKNRWLPHEISLELFKQSFLKQHSYFLGRDLAFMRDTEPILRKELENDKKPCRTYIWKSVIWRPENYVIKRTLHGQTEAIQTVVSTVPTTITSPRTDAYHPIFTLSRVSSKLTSSRWVFWRVSNIFFRTFTWILNVMYFLGFVVPWCSPLSLRALCYRRPFMADLDLSQVNGTLCPKKASQTQTLTSRLVDIWRRVSKARTRFESTPDTGFLGKGWNRFLNRLWNYVFKGGLPSLFFIVCFPIGSISLCMLSLLAAITAPIWTPIVVILFHVCCILIYDVDCPVQDRPKFAPIFFILGSFIFLGICQALVSLLGALVICPIISALIIMWTFFNYGVRLAWDSLMFYSLIKPKGRLPSGNSWLIKRTQGPGLAPDFYFEIRIEQALIAFQTRLETEELNIYYQKTNQLIGQPQTEFKTFFQSCFTPFSAKLVETEGPFRDLIRETLVLRANLEERTMKRRRDLETGLNVATRSRIRMRKLQLERTILAATKMAQSFYPDRIFNRMESEGEVDTFWEARGIEKNDWMNLSILLISEIFCQDFLTPIEEHDVAFPLEMNIKECPIATDVFLTNLDHSLWNGEVPVTMSKVKYQIHSPFLDVSAFNPMARSSRIIEENISIHLTIPLPILHPAFISVIIHNRETENPFSIDSPISQAILKALQDSGPTLNQDCISLEIDSSVSSSDEEDDETPSGSGDQSTPTREDVLVIDSSPSPMYSYGVGDGVEPLEQPRCKSQAHTPTQGKRSKLLTPDSMSGIVPSTSHQTHPTGHSSKASLASPEEINLDDVVLATYGTSV